jgi:hypothetical protein
LLAPRLASAAIGEMSTTALSPKITVCATAFELPHPIAIAWFAVQVAEAPIAIVPTFRAWLCGPNARHTSCPLAPAVA